MGSVKRSVVQFDAPRAVSVVEEAVPVPKAGEVLVEAHVSAISSGTEMLAYRGQLPASMALDETLASMQKEVSYPLRYGYASAGRIAARGDDVPASWDNARVFAFHPHASHFVATPEDLVQLPDGLSFEDAVFLANMETAVSFMMDGRPMIGERVLVVGLGVVGLLLSALLTRQQDLVVDAIDLDRRRCARGAQAGLNQVVSSIDDLDAGYDLVYELSGNPEGLNLAIEKARETGRIVIGSWYGTKPASLALGGRFHRAKLNLYASQVSKIDPVHAGRWSKQRRLDVARRLLGEVRPSQYITHQFSIAEAKKAYAMLDAQTVHALQVIFSYKS